MGVAFLAMTEAWERFSFYGMRGLLVLYMVQELLLPGRIENVAGMDGYRAAVLMASVYLTGFVTGIGSGWLGRFYEPLGAVQFWLMHAGISMAGAAALLVLGPVLRRRLDALEASRVPAGHLQEV